MAAAKWHKENVPLAEWLIYSSLNVLLFFKYLFILKEKKQILLATKIKIAVHRDAAYGFFQGTLYFKLSPGSMVEVRK
jgi:hypothetical protein